MIYQAVGGQREGKHGRKKCHLQANLLLSKAAFTQTRVRVWVSVYGP